MNLDQLAPCPFCGGKASLRNGGPGCFFVQCDTCNATGDDHAKDSAIAAWNRRAPSTPAVTEEMVALDDCPEGLFWSDETLCFMSEYATSAAVNGPFRQRDAYVVATGEYFWGGTSTPEERAKLMVRPIADPDAALSRVEAQAVCAHSEDDMPERIWAGDFDGHGFGHCVAGQQGGLYAGYVRADLVPAPADAVEPRAWTQADAERENEAFHAWWKDRGYDNFPDLYTLTCQNAMHAAWQEAAKRSALAHLSPSPVSAPVAHDIEAITYRVANAKLGEGPSVRCEGPTGFEMDQARAWVKRVLAALRSLSQEPKQ